MTQTNKKQQFVDIEEFMLLLTKSKSIHNNLLWFKPSQQLSATQLLDYSPLLSVRWGRESESKR